MDVMIGQAIELQRRPPIGPIVFFAICAILFALSGATMNPHWAVASLLPMAIAIALSARLELSPDVADLLPEEGEGAALRDYVRVFGRGDIQVLEVRIQEVGHGRLLGFQDPIDRFCEFGLLDHDGRCRQSGMKTYFVQRLVVRRIRNTEKEPFSASK